MICDVPYFRCHHCGGGMDPVTYVSRVKRCSTKKALEMMMSSGALFGTPDRSMEVSNLSAKFMALLDRNSSSQAVSAMEGRILYPMSQGEEGFFLEKRQIRAEEIIETLTFKSGLHRTGLSKTRNVNVMLHRNMAGAPGYLEISSKEGGWSEGVILDHQTETRHMYVSAAPGSSSKPWTKNCLLMSSMNAADRMWEWLSPWASSPTSPVVFAVSRRSGPPDRSFSDGVTVFCSGREPAWAGLLVSDPLVSDVSVFRLPAGYRHMPVKETMSALERGKVSISDDFERVVREIEEAGNKREAREFLDAMFSDPLLNRGMKERFASAASSAGPVCSAAVSLLENESGYCCPVEIGGYIYKATTGGYTKTKEGGIESLFTNFTAFISRKVFFGDRGGVILGLRTPASGSVVETYMPDRDFNDSNALMSNISTALSNAGCASPMAYGKKELCRLPAIITGTRAAHIPEACYNEIGFNGSGGFFLPGEEVPGVCLPGFLPPPSHHVPGDLSAFLSNDPSGLFAESIAFTLEFLFRCSRWGGRKMFTRNHDVDGSIVSAFSGMPVITAQVLKEIRSHAADFRGMPFILPGGFIAPMHTKLVCGVSSVEAVGNGLVVPSPGLLTLCQKACSSSSLDNYVRSVTEGDEIASQLILRGLYVSRVATGGGEDSAAAFLSFVASHGTTWARREPGGMIGIPVAALGEFNASGGFSKTCRSMTKSLEMMGPCHRARRGRTRCCWWIVPESMVFPENQLVFDTSHSG